MKKMFLLAFIVVIVSITSLSTNGWCQVIKNAKATLAKDREGYLVTAKWEVNYQHWKYDFNTITQKGGIWMDCVTSYDSKGYTYKTVVGSAMSGELTRPGLSCHIFNKKIPSKGYYMWVRLKVRIAGNWEDPIWIYAGKIK